MRRGVTWYDSASKAGCENEMLVWIQLKDNSKIVLPNLSTLIDLQEEKDNEKCIYDFEKLKKELIPYNTDIQSIEIFYNKQTCSLKNLPIGTLENNL